MSLLRRILRKSRAPRVARDAAVVLLAGDVPLGTAKLVDESDTGARLQSETPHVFERVTTLLNPYKAEAHLLEVVWTQGNAAGVRYLKSVRLRGFVSPEFAGVKAAWERLVVERPELAPSPLVGGRGGPR